LFKNELLLLMKLYWKVIPDCIFTPISTAILTWWRMDFEV